MPIFVQIIAAISKRNVYNDVQIKVSFVTKFKEYVHFYLRLASFYTIALAVECLHSNFQTNYTSESKMVMKLYKYELSPPARLAHFVAEICQVDIEYVEVNLSKAEQFSTEFLTINPKVSRFSTSTM